MSDNLITELLDWADHIYLYQNSNHDEVRLFQIGRGIHTHHVPSIILEGGISRDIIKRVKGNPAYKWKQNWRQFADYRTFSIYEKAGEKSNGETQE